MDIQLASLDTPDSNPVQIATGDALALYNLYLREAPAHLRGVR